MDFLRLSAHSFGSYELRIEASPRVPCQMVQRMSGGILRRDDSKRTLQGAGLPPYCASVLLHLTCTGPCSREKRLCTSHSTRMQRLASLRHDYQHSNREGELMFVLACEPWRGRSWPVPPPGTPGTVRPGACVAGTMAPGPSNPAGTVGAMAIGTGKMTGGEVPGAPCWPESVASYLACVNACRHEPWRASGSPRNTPREITGARPALHRPPPTTQNGRACNCWSWTCGFHYAVGVGAYMVSLASSRTGGLSRAARSAAHVDGLCGLVTDSSIRAYKIQGASSACICVQGGRLQGAEPTPLSRGHERSPCPTGARPVTGGWPVHGTSKRHQRLDLPWRQLRQAQGQCFRHSARASKTMVAGGSANMR
jgi:hypothetical protein